jgi:hypothetical protein
MKQSSIQYSASSSSQRRNRTCRKIRFDLSWNHPEDEGACRRTVYLSDEEVQAMWWSRSETDQMKLNAKQEQQVYSQAHKHNWLDCKDCSLRQPFLNNVRLIFERSCLECTDFQILDTIVTTRFASLKDDLSLLNAKLPRRTYGVRRVVQVQTFLLRQQEHPSKVVELLRITSLYHSKSFIEIARLVGQADALAALKA